ncbi:hypothetical protein EQG49_01315 [Periweissella cryptocerci]|uniref:Uncharacterized protein n=1 Tax=Periweissella cryptocerci TaxID=2506420 RepID=A0A4P6YRC4_9LACO|nr:hypothetical protein [Periweissella cryptocerci]QBO35188.1 hypothetical protein EQG49_01315 [Periweissella cryptocerci]
MKKTIKILTGLLVAILMVMVFSSTANAASNVAPKAMRGTWYAYCRMPNAGTHTYKIVVGKNNIKEYCAQNSSWTFNKSEIHTIKYGADGLFYKTQSAANVAIAKPSSIGRAYYKGTHNVNGKKKTYLFWVGLDGSSVNYARTKTLAKAYPMIMPIM